MSGPKYELRYLRAGLEMLEDYIQSSELYWSIGISARQGQTPYPQMTLGDSCYSSSEPASVN